ncbi:MAG: family metallopeptidase [Frankiales bacterium]|nr:family metallopeptidase [Frankiales bacterium]
MLHALPRRSLRSRAGSPLVLPVLLITAASGAFGGLALAAPATQPAAEAALRPTALPFTPPVVALEQVADLDRASRSRPRAALTPKPSPKPVAVAPVAAPEPVAPKPVAVPKPSRTRVRAPAAAVRTGGTCPVPSASFTDTYGAARSGGRSHMGTDLLASYGAPVYAVASGVVDTTSSSNGGISLYLRAGNGERYFYAHNSENVARDGQRVEAGDLIARVGSTGNAGSTNHVHFEREVGGQSVNPYAFLRRIC